METTLSKAPQVPHVLHVLPLDLVRLVLEFLFKSMEFHHVVRLLRVSKPMLALLHDLPWLKMVYNHEWYLYEKKRLKKKFERYCINNRLETIKADRRTCLTFYTPQFKRVKINF